MTGAGLHERPPCNTRPDLEPIFTRRDAAARLGVSLATLGSLERARTGPARTRISVRRVGYTLGALTAFIDGRTG